MSSVTKRTKTDWEVLPTARHAAHADHLAQTFNEAREKKANRIMNLLLQLLEAKADCTSKHKPEGVCHHCKKPGHWQRDCSEFKNVQRQTTPISCKLTKGRRGETEEKVKEIWGLRRTWPPIAGFWGQEGRSQGPWAADNVRILEMDSPSRKKPNGTNAWLWSNDNQSRETKSTHLDFWPIQLWDNKLGLFFEI